MCIAQCSIGYSFKLQGHGGPRRQTWNEFQFWVSYYYYSVFEIILFADDTTLLYSHPDIATKINLINEELSEICNWFKANKLFVNASNTNYMMLGTSHTTN